MSGSDIALKGISFSFVSVPADQSAELEAVAWPKVSESSSICACVGTAS